jgi:hypothetical protein
VRAEIRSLQVQKLLSGGLMSRFTSLMLSFGLVFAAIATFMAPRVISLLFTPPVSFGTNCEPAADWAMQKMVSSQIGGLVVGGLVGAVAMAYVKARSRKKEAAQNPHPRSGSSIA